MIIERSIEDKSLRGKKIKYGTRSKDNGGLRRKW